MNSQAYYQTIFDTAGDAIFIHDPYNAQILDVNQAAQSLTGFSKAQLLEMNIEQISVPISNFNFEHALAKIHATPTQGAITFEWLIQAQGQKQVPVEVCLKAVEIEQQTKILALVRDVSQLKSYQAKLGAQQHYFQALLEGCADGIAILDPQLQLNYVSPSLTKLLGYSPRWANKKSVLPYIHPEDRAHLRQYFLRDAKQLPQTTLNYRILNRQGQWRWHEATCKNLLHDATIQGFVVNFRDITARLAAEEKVRSREKQLGHMSRCKTMGELSTALAHELNQPLAALSNFIAGSVIRIQRGQVNSDETLFALNSALDQTERVSAIVRSMRSFLKKGEAHFQTQDLNQLLRDITPLVQLKAQQGQCHLQDQTSVQAIYVHADEILLSQVLINLIFNAVDALQQVQHSRQITIRSWKTAQHARIAIEDNGPGLQGVNPEQLFESFYSSKSDSLGIGLTLSRSIVENHHGHIWVCDNHPGAIFNISLPLQEQLPCTA